MKATKVSQGKVPKRNGAPEKKSSKRPSDEDYALLNDYFEDQPRKKLYMKETLLGMGGFGRVYKVTELETSKKISFADKVISKAIFKKRANAQEKVQKEIEIHKRMNHGNVVKIFHSFEDQNFVHILLENCTQKSLLHVLKYRRTITEPETRYYIKQILMGARYIHKAGYLHRDLKLGNMLLSQNMQVKICDFGLACAIGDSRPGSMCGTPNYLAPEILCKSGHGVAADTWAMGCMAYALLVGTPPFETQALQTTYDKIAKCEYVIPETVSDEAKSLIASMLALDPEERGHLGVAGEPASRNLMTHVFFESGFTPSKLSTQAARVAPIFTEVMDPSRTILEGTRKSDGGHGDSKSLPPPTLGSLSFSSVSTPPGQLFNLATQQTFECVFGRESQEKTFLQTIVQILGKCRDRRLKEIVATNTIPVFINKWVDYSNKFGFGFQLSDGTVGVLFNDSTRIASDGVIIEFTDLKNNAFYMDDKKNSNKYPELKKRVAILNYFNKYMEDNLADSSINVSQLQTVLTRKKTRLTQLKRWARQASTNAVIMETNNRIIQVSFLQERVQVILWEDQDEMFLTLKSGQNAFFTYSFSSLLMEGCPTQVQLRIPLLIVELQALDRVKQVEDPAVLS